jgi:hypothetical protein
VAQTITADDVRPGDVVELPAGPGELLVVSRVRPGDDDETVRLSVGRYTSPWDESSRAGVGTFVVSRSQKLRRHGGSG